MYVKFQNHRFLLILLLVSLLHPHKVHFLVLDQDVPVQKKKKIKVISNKNLTNKRKTDIKNNKKQDIKKSIGTKNVREMH